MAAARIPDYRERWALILAGGDGTRLRPLTRRIAGHEMPKQFCRLIGDATLFEQTRWRASLSVPPGQTMAVVTRLHERFYRPILSDMALGNVVEQPENRDTAPAILYSLLRLAKLAPSASVALFPSDHYVSDEAAFMRHVDSGFSAIESHPELTVLLGIVPDRPEVAYGWIEPGRRLLAEPRCLFDVRRFLEKPPLEIAKGLLGHGGLWNSMVIVGRVSTLLTSIKRAMSRLYASFAAIRPTFGTSIEESAVEGLYARLPSANFSRQVLANFPSGLAVLPVSGVEWSDLGEPGRVMRTLDNLGIQPKWAAA